MEDAVSIATVREGTSRISQVVTLLAVALPPLGLAAAIGALWDVAFHWSDLAIMGALYVLCAFGTTIGFHRYFTHQAFKARAPVKALLAVQASAPLRANLLSKRPTSP